MSLMLRVAVLTTTAAAFLAAQTDPPGRVGRLNHMQGPVSFQPAGVNDWVDATLNRPLISGDYIWVGDQGRAELHVGSTALRLGANTAFEFLTLDDQMVQIRLSEGTLTVRVRYLGRNQVFEIDTPNLAFTVVRPGEYRIDANPDSQTTIVTVRIGEGDITGGGQEFPVRAGQRAVVRGDDQITYNLAAPPGADAWDQWCSSRDRREDQSQSARYVSRELPGYEDLDEYGRWGNQPGYGNVWMPNSVAAGWAPYHDGHWAWIAPWGWTWVDDAPWGFAPYHYGRWASFGGRWGWIPGPSGVTPIYAPALVAWVGGGRGGFSLSFSIGTAAAVGWFPLGPREPYFPSYQVSQGYFGRVNSTNTIINAASINSYYTASRNDAPITNIRYVNQNPNGVTAMPQDSFARGRRVPQDMRGVPAPQLASTQVFGIPTITPQRESVLGARADTASRAARPSAKVMSRPVVARTAPSAAPVPFDRQQPALAKNPGRPLAPTAVQQMRQGAAAPSSPVRLVDKGRVRRVQPTMGAAQAAPQVQRPQVQQQPQVQRPQPAVVDRQKGKQAAPQVQRPQVQQQPQVQRPQPAVVDRQKGKQAAPQVQRPQVQQQPQVQRPQPAVVDRQKGKQAEPQVQRPQVQQQPQVQRSQPAVVDRQKGKQAEPQVQRPPVQQQQPQVQRPQPPVVDRQKGKQAEPQVQRPPVQQQQPQVQRPQPPVVDRQKGKQAEPQVQRPPVQPPTPQAQRPQPPAREKQQAQPVAPKQEPARPQATPQPKPEQAPKQAPPQADKDKGKDRKKKTDK